MKKIDDLLVGVPCPGDIHHTDWNSHMMVAHPSEGFVLEPGQAVGEPAASSLKLGFEQLGAESVGKARAIEFDSGMESWSGCFVAGSEVV